MTNVIGTFVLACAVGLLSIVLQGIVVETKRLKALYIFPKQDANKYRREYRRGGQSLLVLPRFRKVLLDSSVIVTENDLRDNSHALLFIDDNVIDFATFTASVFSIWHKVDGDFYFICKDSDEGCRRQSQQYRLYEAFGESLRVIADPDGELAKAFGVFAMPSAVIVSSGHIAKTGWLDSLATRSRQ